MPAGNWDSTLVINSQTGFVEWPAGPLTVDSDGDEMMVWIQAWLTQEATGAVQITYQETFPPDPSNWVAAEVQFPESWIGGLFQPGAALGTAVAVSVKDGVQSFYYWTQEVELVELARP